MITTVTLGADTFRVDVKDGGEVCVEGTEAALRVTPEGAGTWLVDDGSRRWRLIVSGSGEWREVFADGEIYHLRVETAARRRTSPAHAQADQVTVPMPAKVVAILVGPGQAVRRGEIVVKVEAMKMELPLRAPRDGVVRAVSCREGDLVQPGVTLLEIA